MRNGHLQGSAGHCLVSTIFLFGVFRWLETLLATSLLPSSILLLSHLFLIFYIIFISYHTFLSCHQSHLFFLCFFDTLLTIFLFIDVFYFFLPSLSLSSNESQLQQVSPNKQLALIFGAYIIFFFCACKLLHFAKDFKRLSTTSSFATRDAVVAFFSKSLLTIQEPAGLHEVAVQGRDES